MTVFGTRPDTIKMAPVVAALEAAGSRVVPLVCVTAQHREMLDDLLELFEVRPDYDLDIMTGDQTLTQITTRVLNGIEKVLRDAQPDVVLVHGDTTTSSAAALGAFYAGIPVGHVEAGLRTYNRSAPFPEEMNRRLTGVLASFHFAPTALARRHLLQERVPAEDVFVTGNTVIDAFLATAGRDDLPFPPGWERLDPCRDTILLTAHRRENHPFMREMCLAFKDIVDLPQRPQILWPVHPSPHVRPLAHEILDGVAGVVLTEPMNYAQMAFAVRKSSFILTDSGGLQEEAPCLGKPVLVMRAETERPEGRDAGTLELVGSDRATIVAAAQRLLTDQAAYQRMARASNPYGDGQAGARVIGWLLARLRQSPYPPAFTSEA
ncbi:MAG: UDP-N-acetylglucosamine 2-epimerase (non-hydrolyzing) [Candidatus Eremiobacteraeota bacterium]|nr:UDP-N-acetylglucosamine 2-epimerase (non-hydrolyzing) [Candidatus Eremiobacteraeota bacterium]